MNQLKKRIGAGVMAVVMALTATTGITGENIAKAEESVTIHNPDIGDTVIWDCVYYGTYPQTEVTEITDSDIYDSLQKAVNWDENGDIIIGEEKYRRIQKKDAVSTAASYNWENDNAYHYFKYEPIKWRVLEENEREVYLVSDKILDTQKFNQKARTASWEKSTIRSWLNDLGATENTAEIDYSKNGFIHTAFTSEEQEQLLLSGKDKVKLLTESQVTENAYVSYGFTSDETRICQSSDYAKAMGVGTDEKGFSDWWLATNGNTELTARYVRENGVVYTKGYSIAYAGNGVRVTILLNCKDRQYYSYAGKVSSDGIQQTPTPNITILPTPIVTITADVPTKPAILTGTPTSITPSVTTPVSPTPTQATPSPTVTLEPTITIEPTASPKLTITQTPISTVTLGPTVTLEPTITIEPTASPKLTITQTPISTVTLSPTVTPEPTVTLEPTAPPRPTITQPPISTVTLSPTVTLEPIITIEPTASPKLTITQPPTVLLSPTITLEPTVTSEPTITPKPITPTESTATPEPTKVSKAKKGAAYKDKKTKAVYKVTKVAEKTSGTVQYVKPTTNNVTIVTIPATIKINGNTYKVTSVASKALQKKKKVKKVVIGKNVSVIGKNAFYGCKKLKTIQIKTSKLKEKKVGKNAFKGIYKKAKIIVPAKKQKAYKKILKTAGAGEEVKITK